MSEMRDAKSRARLRKLVVVASALPESDERSAVLEALSSAFDEADKDPEYARQLAHQLGRTVNWLRLRARVMPTRGSSNIQLVVRGIAAYGLIVGVIGICVVMVHLLKNYPNHAVILWLDNSFLLAIFQTVSDLGVKPEAYYWGIWGGAGAVASMVRRFDALSSAQGSPWLFFAQGLFNPIVGSLSAVVVVGFVKAGQLNLLKDVPIPVVGFFAGFSERLLVSVGTSIGAVRKQSGS